MWSWLHGLNCTFADAGDGGGGGGGSGEAGAASGAPLALSDDALVQIPGIEKPVKFGEWRQGFVPKADHERVTGEMTAYKQQVGQSISSYLRSLQAGTTGGDKSTGEKAQIASDLEELLASIENEPFIDGKMAKKAFERILRESQGGAQRVDKGMGYLYQAITAMGKRLQAMEQGRSEENLNGQIRSWLKDNDYDPDDYQEMAQDYFAAYEGKPTDIFAILKKRIEQIEGARDKRETKKRQAKEIALPGRGGDTRVAAKAKGMEDKSPEEVADLAFDLFQMPDRG